MRFFVLILMLLVAGPALAQEPSGNVIRVIRDDGTVKEFKIPEVDQPPSPPAVERRVTPESAAVAKPPPLPLSPPVEEVYDPPPPVYSDPIVVPKTKELSVPKAASVPKATRTLKKTKPPPDIAVPRHKPVLQTIPRGAEITKDRALYIALEAAPPSRDVKVFRGEYQGKPVFVVFFKTEQGGHEVLVDVHSGEIVANHKVVNAGASTPYIPRPVKIPKQ